MAVGDATMTYITGLTFSLHYKFTTILLILCSALIVLEVTWAGSPIVCGSTLPMDEHFIASCWRFGLWLRGDSAGPNLTNTWLDFQKCTSLPSTYHYSFLLLLVQAVFFYIPFYGWYVHDNGCLHDLVATMTGGDFDDNDQTQYTKLTKAAEAFCKNMNKRGRYYWFYVFYQFLNFLNVVGQIMFMSYMLGINFATYGLNVLNNWRVAGTNEAFPLFAYCKMPDLGSKETNYGLCILSVNAINEKVYFVLWFWFLCIFIISTVELMWRLLMAVAPNEFNSFCFGLNYRLHYFSPMNVDTKWLTKRCDAADYFVLLRIAENTIDETKFRNILAYINVVLEKQDFPEAVMNNKIGEGDAKCCSDSTPTAVTFMSVAERKENEYSILPGVKQ